VCVCACILLADGRPKDYYYRKEYYTGGQVDIEASSLIPACNPSRAHDVTETGYIIIAVPGRMCVLGRRSRYV